MSDDTLTKLGTLRSQDEGRDAIHIAVVTMQATHAFRPVRALGVTARGVLCEPDDAGAIGVVDPFLPPTQTVRQGDWFYVFLKPATITGLRHVWSHPAFPDVPVNVPVPSASAVSDSPVVTTDNANNVRVVQEDADADARAYDIVNTYCQHVGIPVEGFLDALSTKDTYIDIGDDVSLRNNGDYIHISGSVVSEDIPTRVLVAAGRLCRVVGRPAYFSCAC